MDLGVERVARDEVVQLCVVLRLKKLELGVVAVDLGVEGLGDT